MLVTSRSYREYLAMFDLTGADLAGGERHRPVVDCCAGASSFVAELAARGGTGVAVDPAYAGGLDAMRRATAAALRDGTRIVDAHADRFVWRRDPRGAVRVPARGPRDAPDPATAGLAPAVPPRYRPAPPASAQSAVDEPGKSPAFAATSHRTTASSPGPGGASACGSPPVTQTGVDAVRRCGGS